MPLEAWQPGRTVVAGCVRVSWVRRSRTLSPQTGISCGWLLALLDEAESFFISHIRQGLRILLFLCGNFY
jgi:hypothetical protein